MEVSKTYLSVKYWRTTQRQPQLSISLQHDCVFQKASPGPIGETLGKLVVERHSLIFDKFPADVSQKKAEEEDDALLSFDLVRNLLLLENSPV